MKSIILFIILAVTSFAFAQSEVISEEVALKNGAIQLPGTLTFAKEQMPLVIWIHGSGNVDRNGNQKGLNINANYIKQFRDSINQVGIAFYSYDKRTSIPENLAISTEMKFIEFVDDAVVAINHFRNGGRFSEIILIGHSQGSLVAMLASEKVDKYISLAGPSQSFDATVVKQVMVQSPSLGVTTQNLFNELKETGAVTNVDPLLLSIFAAPNLEFLSSYIKYNPSEEIKKIKIPTLVIHGTSDLQVRVEDAQKLHEELEGSQLEIIEKMNHLLKTVETLEDNQKSYSDPNFPVSAQLIEVITKFIKK